MQDQSNRNHTEPWNQNSYETGSTRPPKPRKNVLVTVLLVLVITLGGISSLLGVMNLHLSLQLSGKNGDPNIILSTEDPDPTTLSTEQEETTVPSTQPTGDASIDLITPPGSVDNVPQTGGFSLQEIYEKAIPSVVSISCTLRNGTATGTGIVLTANGYIVTNAHVVEGASAVEVLFYDDQTYDAQVIGADSISDLAVLKVDCTGLTAASFADSASLRVGDAVVAIGDPLGIAYRGTMTDGIISALNRNVTVENRTMTLIQTNAALNSGNSGGPLLNCFGQVIGINTMKISAFVDEAGVEGLGFAIPSSTVKDIVDQLISHGYVSGRPSLGVTVKDLPFYYQHIWGLPSCVYVSDVEEGGAADKAGLESGDVILSVDDVDVSSPDDLEALLYNYAAGDTIELRVYRKYTTYRVKVTLSEAKN